jgi:vacuolar-type H+-ATPase catalytic subunit A/Vma1
MTTRIIGQTKRTIVLDDDIMKTFEAWADETAMSRKWAVQVAFWSAMKLSPQQRQALVSEILTRNTDASPPVSSKTGHVTVPSFCPFISGKKGNCPGPEQR